MSLDVYSETKSFPESEKYGLTSQLRRACCSVPTNIVEGCGRTGSKDFSRFLDIAMGSACETEYLLLLSCELGILAEMPYKSLNETILEVKRMLSSLSRSVRGNRNHRPTE